ARRPMFRRRARLDAARSSQGHIKPRRAQFQSVVRNIKIAPLHAAYIFDVYTRSFKSDTTRDLQARACALGPDGTYIRVVDVQAAGWRGDRNEARLATAGPPRFGLCRGHG